MSERRIDIAMTGKTWETDSESGRTQRGRRTDGQVKHGIAFYHWLVLSNVKSTLYKSHVPNAVLHHAKVLQRGDGRLQTGCRSTVYRVTFDSIATEGTADRPRSQKNSAAWMRILPSMHFTWIWPPWWCDAARRLMSLVGQWEHRRRENIATETPDYWLQEGVK